MSNDFRDRIKRILRDSNTRGHSRRRSLTEEGEIVYQSR